MGLRLGDYNDDGMVDIFVTPLGTNILYRNLRVVRIRVPCRPIEAEECLVNRLYLAGL